MLKPKSAATVWWSVIAVMVLVISFLHYTTPIMKWQYHLFFMQAFFIPILVAAFQFGVRGGLGTAVAVSILYFPHVMLQWGGLVEANLMHFLQIILFNVIGYFTGLKAQAEIVEKQRFQKAAQELENSLQQLHRQAEQLAELEEQLRFADRLAVIGELTASLAHEVRNPLGSIRGAVEILQAELPANLRASEFFQILIQETKRLSEVLENYLHLARRQKSTRSVYPLAETVQSVLQLLTPNARKQRVAINVRLPESPILLQGDPNHLRQVLLNLFINSFHALPNGGRLELRAEVGAERQASQTEEQDFVELQIADDGPGLSPELLAQIFKPFFTTKPDGTGLGLAIVKRIADTNHWQIRAESEAGRGIRFILRLPLNRKHEKEIV